MGSPKVKVGLSRPPLFYYSKAYVLTKKNHHFTFLVVFSSPNFSEVISHTQLDCDLCLLQNQTSSIELSFSLSTTHGEKGEVQISNQKNLYPFSFQIHAPKKYLLLRKKTGVFKEKTNLVLFLANFIFLTLPFIFLQKIQKNTPNEGRLKLCSKYGWAGRS